LQRRCGINLARPNPSYCGNARDHIIDSRLTRS
jgi:hypothetical protein